MIVPYCSHKYLVALGWRYRLCLFQICSYDYCRAQVVIWYNYSLKPEGQVNYNIIGQMIQAGSWLQTHVAAA